MDINLKHFILALSIISFFGNQVLAQEYVSVEASQIYKLPIGAKPKQLVLSCATPASPVNIYVHTLKSKKSILMQLSSKKDGAVKSISLPSSISRSIIDMDANIIWSLDKRTLKIIALDKASDIKTLEIPKEANNISAIEIGFGGVPFIADQDGKKLYVWENDQWQLIVEGDQLGEPTALLRIGGAMYIGTKTDLRVLNLRSKKVTVLTDKLTGIIDIAEDHIGHLIVLAKGKKQLARVDLEGGFTFLPLNTSNISHLNFNPDNSEFLAINSKTNVVKGWDYFQFIGGSRSAWEKEKKRLMHPFTKNNLVLSGSEYLVHTIKEAPKKQELLILQGFYPEKNVIYQGEPAPATADKELLACAEKSFEALQKWFKNPPAEFQATVALGIPPLFWMMTDDYSAIKEDLIEVQRPAQLWYWKRTPSVTGRVSGYWKWEAVLTQDCKCELPDEQQIRQFLKEYVAQQKND